MLIVNLLVNLHKIKNMKGLLPLLILLIVEFYNDDSGLTNLIEALQHVEACELKNKEVLILMNKWDNDYYSHYFKSWVKQFKSKGVERVCMKLDGFKSYKEL